MKTELRLIRTGDRNRRFHVRNKADDYLRSFISEINKVLEDYEKVHISREELGKKMASEISDIRSSIESGESNKEALLKAVISLQEKSKDLLKDPKRH